MQHLARAIYGSACVGVTALMITAGHPVWGGIIFGIGAIATFAPSD